MFFSVFLPLNAPQHRQSGFSLLEVLVVLVIVSLISTLLLQGFGYSLNLRAKVLRQLGRVQYDELVESWFKKTTSRFLLREKDIQEPLFFKGTNAKIRGDTLVSLSRPLGVIDTIEWSLQSGSDGYTRLFYTGELTNSSFKFSKNKSRTHWKIAQWLNANAAFTYLDKQGGWHESWPTENYPDELPSGIMLTVKQEQRPFFLYSRIISEKKAPSIYRP